MSVLTGEEKVAMLLLQLGPQAEGVLTRFTPEQGARVRAQMQRLRQAPQAQNEIDAVLREFQQRLLPAPGGAPVGPRLAAVPRAEAPGADAKESEKGAEPEAAEDEEDPIAALAEVDVERLA